MPAARDHVHLYRLEKPSGLILLSAGTAAGEVTLLENRPGKIRLSVTAAAPQRLTWKETAYPGWKLYLGHALAPYVPGEGIFRQWDIHPGSYDAVQLFRPFSFYAGLVLTLLAIITLGICGIIKLCAD